MVRRKAAAQLRAGLVVGAVLFAACSSGSGAEAPPSTTAATSTSSSSSTTSTSTTSTTTTTEPALREFEPLYADPALSVEEQVEDAYLFHWEVLLDSGRTGRTDYLPLVFTGDILEQRIRETQQFVDAGERIGGHVEHDYGIVIVSDEEAVVVDDYLSALSRIGRDGVEIPNAATGKRQLFRYHLKKTDHQWQVFHVVEYED